MKTILLILLFAQLNYNRAINEVKNLSDFSDMAITETMYQYGYRCDINADITMRTKVNALFINPCKHE
jgi:hypothetical protein